ncbi:TonB-dependent receptor [Sphingomonas parva]|uniref:TonB-dependent receptor n=1 Tax=Sphingomonas parva TaxID=2555898 RepID=A0A4Y8ZKZ7_9SPHN|nr:TonB-dependent receptor [Sphingomonas parva]TFI56681.1 TonB-dependent receptor [Sphingomonas parva]
MSSAKRHPSTLLRGSTSLSTLRPLAIGVAALVALDPALAQEATETPALAAADAQPVASDDLASATGGGEAAAQEEIVVTGSLFRRTNTETPSPVTVLSSETLQQRGINTVSDAVQSLAANNAGTIPQGWNGGGNNFALGATAVSLRGLSSAYTLTVFDGLRAPNYPLSDDGRRSFVDLNTIPEAIVDRIEVLRDGASSTYGADAVAGVVNVITKKEITGLHINASAGISQRGNAGEQRVDVTLGHGDLADQGFNFYVNGTYQHNDALYARDLDAPFNSADLSGFCGVANGEGTAAAGAETCLANNVVNGIQHDGTFRGQGSTTVPFVRAYLAPAAGADPLLGSTTAVAGSRYQILNPAAGCGSLQAITLSGAQLTNTAGNNGANASALQCQQDLVHDYLQILPKIDRFGLSLRGTARIGDDAEAYVMANFFQTDTRATSSNANWTSANGFRTAAGGTQVSLNSLALPVYVCAARVNCATAADRRLNPNNPFAAQGQVARLAFRLPWQYENEVRTRTYRAAAGITGSFGDDWRYNVDLVGAHIDLRRTSNGYVFAQHLLDVVADGSFNFLDPLANSQATLDYLMPENRNTSTSDTYQAQASLAHSFLELPGGPLQVAVGAAIRYEALDAPSGNAPNNDHPLQRYVGINAVGAKGHRYVESAYFEVDAPILDQLEVNLSGRYDHYSSGQSNFSPKIGAKLTPIPQLALRGTYSQGFRIPSFNEAYGLPTTGYVAHTVTNATNGGAAYLAAHNNNGYAAGAYSYGLTATGNPNLDPERSRNFTAGLILQPVPWMSLTLDYFNIKVKDLITGADYSEVIDAYYGNNGVVNIPGITVVPGAPDPAFPNALPQIGFIQYSYQNADWQKTSGLDFSAEARIPLGSGMRLRSTLEASYLINFSKSVAGQVQRYDGTLSPCDVTSCSGAPKWRGSWQNTLDFGPATLSATAYYTSGYSEASVDYGGDPEDCLASLGASVPPYLDGATPFMCRQKSFVTVDMSGSVKVSDGLTLYANLLNVFDKKASLDLGGAYGIYGYNPAWHQSGAIGRYFRFGARLSF